MHGGGRAAQECKLIVIRREGKVDERYGASPDTEAMISQDSLVGMAARKPAFYRRDRSAPQEVGRVCDERAQNVMSSREDEQICDVAPGTRNAHHHVAEDALPLLCRPDHKRARAEIGVTPVQVVFRSQDDEFEWFRGLCPAVVYALIAGGW